MQTRVKVLFGRGKALLASAGFTSVLFYHCSAASLRAGTWPERQVLLASLIFVLLFAALRLFTLACDRRLRFELAALGGEQRISRGVKFFVLYKEAIKTSVGVSLTLAWLAGLLLVTDKLGDSFFLVPLLAGTVVTAVLAGLARGFVVFVDHIPYPWGE